MMIRSRRWVAVDSGRAEAVKEFRDYNGEAAITGSAVVEVDKVTIKEYLGKDKPLLVELYAPWCDHCKKFAPVYEEVAKTLAVEDRVKVLKADAATDNTLAGKHDVSAFP